LLVLGIALTACTSSTITRSILQQDPAAQISMPGSRLLGDVGGDQRLTPTGPSPAFHGHLAATSESPPAVREYFDDRVRALGWIEDRPPILGSSERQGWGWCKPGVRFRLTIVDRERLASAGIEFEGELPPFIYDASLIASDRPCPLAEATWPPEASP
jgi:hypothetical protein